MNWFRKKPQRTTGASAKAEHAVIVRLRLSDSGFGTAEERHAIHEISARLAEAIASAGAGEFDGDGFGQGEAELFKYGPDANRLFDAISPILSSWPALKGGQAIKRFGPPGAPSERIEFV